MTKFYREVSVLILMICLVGLTLPCVGMSAEPVSKGRPESLPSREMIRINADLERQVKHLKAEVAAQRKELSGPGMTEVIGGIGYIVGIFGVLGWRAARKKSINVAG